MDLSVSKFGVVEYLYIHIIWLMVASQARTPTQAHDTPPLVKHLQFRASQKPWRAKSMSQWRMRKHLLCPLWPMIFLLPAFASYAHFFLQMFYSIYLYAAKSYPPFKFCSDFVSSIRLSDWPPHPTSSWTLLWCHSFLKTNGWATFSACFYLTLHQGLANNGLQ